MRRGSLQPAGAILAAALFLAGCTSTAPLGAAQESPGTEVVPAPPEMLAGPTEEVAETTEGSMKSDGSVTVMVIQQSESEARFIIDEVLRGSPKTVIGTTSQITGEIRVDKNSPAATVLGPFSVEASTLKTDSSFRNEAIYKAILQTGEFPFVTFEPTSVDGLPETVSVGDQLEFQVTGNLTIRDITHEATFDVTVEVVADNILQGSASTTINRADYNLTIPSVPQVADVSEQVRLELNFVAAAGG
jgi:polyisoprenoid-binding protein YceI